MKKHKFFGDDYLETVDLLDRLPEKIINSLRYHKIIPFPNEDVPWYLWRGLNTKYREAIGQLCTADFLHRNPEYEDKYKKYDKVEKKVHPKDSMFQ